MRYVSGADLLVVVERNDNSKELGGHRHQQTLGGDMLESRTARDYGGRQGFILHASDEDVTQS